MNSRLKQFLAAENISQSQFADTIKVVRASVSHVLSGRNKPGYDFMTAIMTAYPHLNIEWLMLGKGKMYKNSQDSKEVREILPPYSVDEENPQLFHYDEDLRPADSLMQEPQFVPLTGREASEPDSNRMPTLDNVSQSVVKQRKATKIIIFYDDDSFQEIEQIS